MSRPSLNYCALRYLNQWLSKDRYFCEALEGNDRPAKLKALSDAASFYGVARNLPKAFDAQKGLSRYEPLLEVIDGVSAGSFEGITLVPAIRQVRDDISQRYGNRDVLSLTTKFLWIKLKSPILIYDSQAKKALDNPNNIAAYYDKWQIEFKKVQADIDAACRTLPSVHTYCITPNLFSSSDIENIAATPWFKERVFDIYLWSLGS